MGYVMRLLAVIIVCSGPLRVLLDENLLHDLITYSPGLYPQ